MARTKVSSKDIYDWIRTKIAEKDRRTNQAVCPFAKKVLQDETIQVVPGKSDLVAQINHSCDVFAVLGLDIVVVYIQYKITEGQLKSLCAKAQQRNPKYAIMYDHPDNNGLHKGVSFSFQKCPLVMIQDLNKLQDAQRKLRRTSYYQSWGLDPGDDMFY